MKGLLLNILLILILQSCSSPPPDYYKKIKINYSDSNLVGIYPILNADSAKINGYHFTYDEKNRPIQIEYLQNESFPQMPLT